MVHFSCENWPVNQKTILQEISVEHRESKILFNFYDAKSIKTLGLYRDPSNNFFFVSVTLELAYIFRFINDVKRKSADILHLSLYELQQALSYLIKFTQRIEFVKVIKSISSD